MPRLENYECRYLQVKPTGYTTLLAITPLIINICNETFKKIISTVPGDPKLKLLLHNNAVVSVCYPPCIVHNFPTSCRLMPYIAKHALL